LRKASDLPINSRRGAERSAGKTSTTSAMEETAVNHNENSPVQTDMSFGVRGGNRMAFLKSDPLNRNGLSRPDHLTPGSTDLHASIIASRESKR
jgi:hypothetical protein